jgi:hypothetical protein
LSATSKIKVDVDSAEFVEFKKRFDDYAKTLSAIPDAWVDIAKATDRTKSNFESVANSMKVVGSTFVAIGASGKEFYQVTTSTARHWKDLAVSTGTVSKNILHATESLLKWTGILSLVTGGAGLFGFDRLAHSVSTQRTEALGVGFGLKGFVI